MSRLGTVASRRVAGSSDRGNVSSWKLTVLCSQFHVRRPPLTARPCPRRLDHQIVLNTYLLLVMSLSFASANEFDPDVARLLSRVLGIER